MKINKQTIKELSEYLSEFNLTEIEYTDKDTKIKVSKTNTNISQPIVSQNINKSVAEKNDIPSRKSYYRN